MRSVEMPHIDQVWPAASSDVEVDADLFHRLAAGAGGGILVGFADPGGGFEEGRGLAHQQHGRAGQLHQQRHPPLGIVGQDRDGGPVILDLAGELHAVVARQGGDAELQPAVMGQA